MHHEGAEDLMIRLSCSRLLGHELAVKMAVVLFATATSIAGCASSGEELDVSENESDLSRSDRESVYVMDNVAHRNAVLRFRRTGNGRLERAGTFPTGGLG